MEVLQRGRTLLCHSLDPPVYPFYSGNSGLLYDLSWLTNNSLDVEFIYVFNRLECKDDFKSCLLLMEKLETIKH